ncbi:unnamed protein product [Victoria cruziana]
MASLPPPRLDEQPPQFPFGLLQSRCHFCNGLISHSYHRTINGRILHQGCLAAYEERRSRQRKLGKIGMALAAKAAMHIAVNACTGGVGGPVFAVISGSHDVALIKDFLDLAFDAADATSTVLDGDKDLGLDLPLVCGARRKRHISRQLHI